MNVEVIRQRRGPRYPARRADLESFRDGAVRDTPLVNLAGRLLLIRGEFKLLPGRAPPDTGPNHYPTPEFLRAFVSDH